MVWCWRHSYSYYLCSAVTWEITCSIGLIGKSEKVPGFEYFVKIASVIHWCFSGVKIRPKLPQFSPSSSVWIDVVLLIRFSPLLWWCSSLDLHLFMELRHVVLCLELNYRSLQMLFKVVYYFFVCFCYQDFCLLWCRDYFSFIVFCWRLDLFYYFLYYQDFCFLV